MRPEGAPHTAPSRGIACVLAAPPPAHTRGIASSGERGFPPHTWFSDEVEYLGHIVRPGHLQVHNRNFDALKHAEFATTKTRLKSFLGMCIVYRRFVKVFAKRAKPLNALTRAEIPPDLPSPTDMAIAAMEDIRNALLCTPVLPCQWPIGISSLTLTHAPTKLVVPFSRRNRANCFILSDIGAEDSLPQSKTTPPRSANA